MRCLSPIKVLKPEYRNMEQSELKYINDKYMLVPCGKCSACLRNKQHNLALRLLAEQKMHNYTYFLTLTYDNDHITLSHQGFPTLVKRDVQLFFKRLRKRIELRYYLIGEYGFNGLRPHYHAIFFVDDELDVQFVNSAWQQGFITVSPCNIRRINYVAGYYIEMINQDLHDCVKPFSLSSHFLGDTYLLKAGITNIIKENGVVKLDGRTYNVPRRYKDQFKSTLSFAQLLNYQCFNKLNQQSYEQENYNRDYQSYREHLDANSLSTRELSFEQWKENRRKLIDEVFRKHCEKVKSHTY